MLLVLFLFGVQAAKRTAARIRLMALVMVQSKSYLYGVTEGSSISNSSKDMVGRDALRGSGYRIRDRHRVWRVGRDGFRRRDSIRPNQTGV